MRQLEDRRSAWSSRPARLEANYNVSHDEALWYCSTWGPLSGLRSRFPRAAVDFRCFKHPMQRSALLASRESAFCVGTDIRTTDSCACRACPLNLSLFPISGGLFSRHLSTPCERSQLSYKHDAIVKSLTCNSPRLELLGMSLTACVPSFC